MTVLTCYCINEEFFYRKNEWPICQAAKRKEGGGGRNNELTVRRGSTVVGTYYLP